MLCHVFQFFGSRPKFGEFVEMAISNYQWQRMHDRYVIFVLWLFLLPTTVLFLYVHFFSRHILPVRFFFEANIFFLPSTQKFPEAGSTTTRSTTIADGKFDPGIGQCLRQILVGRVGGGSWMGGFPGVDWLPFFGGWWWRLYVVSVPYREVGVDHPKSDKCWISGKWWKCYILCLVSKNLLRVRIFFGLFVSMSHWAT